MRKGIDFYMSTELVTFYPDEEVVSAMRILLKRHLSGAPVIDRNKKLIGVLSKKDCLEIIYRAAYHQDLGGTVEQYMSRDVEHIEAQSSVLDVAEKFLNSNFRRFPVLRDGRLVGQISRRDILRALDEKFIEPI